MKRLISFGLVLLMLICIFLPAAYADNAEAVVFTLESDKSDSFKVGDTFSITLTAPNVQIAALDGYLRFDLDYLEVESKTFADNFIGEYNLSSGVKQFKLSGVFLASPFPTLGTVATIVFKVKAIPPRGRAISEISFENATYSVDDQTLIPITCEALQLHEHATNDSLHFAAREATCQLTGTIEYWRCSVCSKLFSDENLTQEVTSIVTPLGDHTYVHYGRVEPTEETDGNTEYWRCSVCQRFFSTENGLLADGSSSEINELDTILDKLIPDIVDNSILPGDVNNDGVVSGADLLAMRMYFANRNNPSYALKSMDNADCNGDGVVSGADLLAMRMYFANRNNPAYALKGKTSSP